MEELSKPMLRSQARKILAGISVESRGKAAGEICRRLGELPEWAGAGTVGIYAAMATEPDLSRLLDAEGKAFCFPRISGDIIEFHRCDAVEHLRPGAWKLMEPDPERCPVVPVAEIDLLLIPGLAFTRSGGRLGRGGGFYDRFLSGIHPRAVKLGVCFHAQLVPLLPLEIHDHAVDFVITERETIRRA